MAMLRVWPHRSLSRCGFAGFIVITCALFLLPLFAVLGTAVWWMLLPFLAGAVALLWYFIERSYADGALREELRLWSDHIELTRDEPCRVRRLWTANPHWVRVNMRPEGGPVDNYLTLKGGGREVELGAFLSPEERVALKSEVELALARLRGPASGG